VTTSFANNARFAEMLAEPDAQTEQVATIENRTLHVYAPNALSHSRLGVFQRCQRRFYIEYERGMERIGSDLPAFRMGGAFARALELNDPKMSVKENYADLLDAADSQKRIDELMIEAALVEWYAAKYIDIYGPCQLREIEYEFPIPGTAHTFRGAADGLSVPELTFDTTPFGVEDKFKSRWTEADIANLDLDTQITAEVAGLRHAGHPVNEIKYRVTLKPRLVRKKGRGKNPVAETVAEYVSRCIEEVEENEKDYFLEYSQTRTDDEIADWLSQMQDYAEQIDGARERGKYPRSKETCSWAGGCAHREICCGVESAASLYQVKEGYPGSESNPQ